jgi:hypothetical protein
MTFSLRDFVFVGVGVVLGAVALERAWAETPEEQAIVNSGTARGAAGAPMPGVRYQYRCETKWPWRQYDPDVIKQLNYFGSQGWHLLPPMITRAPNMAYADVYCFERAY